MEKDKSSNKIFGILLLTVIAFSFGIFFGRNISSTDVPLITSVFKNSSKDVNMDLFWDVWNIMESKYVDPSKVTQQEKLYGAIKGMVDSYDDSATIFLDPEETKAFNDTSEGKTFEGIGAELGYDSGFIIIVSPIDGSPAKAAGIRAGDFIVAVDDVEVTKKDNITDIVNKIRGEAGTIVKLKILHKDEQTPIDIEIQRGAITVPSMSVDYKGDVAIIDIARFTDSSYTAWTNRWDSLVAEVNSKNIKKVILDLRGNPGGYFDAAIYAADDFLDENITIAQQEDGDGNVQKFSSTRGGKLLNPKVVVLVDSGSASASEILSGAIQKNNRGIVIGTKTYGKGTAQNVVDLTDGSSIHVTILKWLLPDGGWLNRENPITPDIEVENSSEDFVNGTDKQMDKALEEINK